MRVVVADNKNFNLDKSALHKAYADKDKNFLSLNGDESIKGAVVFDSNIQVLPMVSAWLTYAVRYNKISPGTATTFGKNIGYFIKYLQSHVVFKSFKADEALLYIEKHNIREYMAYLKDEKGLKTTTIRNRDMSLMSFFNDYLCAARSNKPALRDDNPYDDGLISYSAKSKLIEMCSIDELNALLSSTKLERERVLLQFMYDSGVRRAEVCKIRKEHVTDALNFDKHSQIIDDTTIQIPGVYKPFYVEGVKGRRRETKPRFTVVSFTTLLRVKRYHSSPLYRRFSRQYTNITPAFLNAEGGAYTPSSISKLFLRLSKRALKYGYIDRLINPHMMRHGFAGSVLRSPDLGSDAVERLLTVQVCLGHAHLSTTQIYTSLPYDIYGILCDENGEVLTRSEIMGRVYKQTKTSINLRAKK